MFWHLSDTYALFRFLTVEVRTKIYLINEWCERVLNVQRYSSFRYDVSLLCFSRSKVSTIVRKFLECWYLGTLVELVYMYLEWRVDRRHAAVTHARSKYEVVWSYQHGLDVTRSCVVGGWSVGGNHGKLTSLESTNHPHL